MNKHKHGGYANRMSDVFLPFPSFTMPPKGRKRSQNTTTANTQLPTNGHRATRSSSSVGRNGREQTLTEATRPQTEANCNTNKGDFSLLYMRICITDVLTVEKRKRAPTTSELIMDDGHRESELFFSNNYAVSLNSFFDRDRLKCK